MSKVKYTAFNIEPGMSSWFDMPEDYKEEYYSWEKNMVEKKKNKEQMTWQLDGRTKKKKRSMNSDFMGNSVSNFIDSKYFEKRRKELAITPGPKRPKIVFISDVSGWAWWNKSKYLQMYLSDEFDIDVVCVIGHDAKSGINPGKYDLYFTYGYSYVAWMNGVDLSKRITGVTAHRARRVIQPYMRMADNIHANSLLLLAELKKMLNHDRIYYIPNGVDEELFVPIKPIGAGDVLIPGHVGKDCPQKNQTSIIQPAIDKAGVEGFYNLNDFRTRVPYCEMYKQYQEMDVFIVASIEDGTPNGALEAAACGRPIISNRIGNMPEFIKNGYNGFLVDMNIDSYVEKIKYLNENRDKLVEMGKNARTTVEQGWTWKIQSENYRKMFRKILKK